MTTLPSDLVLGLSVETYDDVLRREFARPPDRLLRHVHQSPRIDGVMVVEPWRSRVSQTIRRVRPRYVDATPTSDLDPDILSPMRLRRRDPADVGALARSYADYSRRVGRAARRRGFDRPPLITFNPFVAAHADPQQFRTITYVGRDDWSAFPPHKHLWPAYRAAYRTIAQHEIRVAAVSDVLMERIAPRGPHRVVPNGVDVDVWAARPTTKPTALAALPRPWIVYTGTIDERLSLEALVSVSQALPEGTVVLVGPQPGNAHTRIAAEIPNARLLATVGQADLAAIVHGADVCVVPHVVSRLTEAMSPLKVYEYLAAGRPVVATDLGPIRGVHPSVDLVAEPGAFGVRVRAALARGPLGHADRLAFVTDNAWSSRCDSILDLALAE